jgi:hypothetical protein
VAGRILLNAPLVKGMGPKTQDKMPTSLLMFLISVVEGAEEKGNHIFKFESVAARDEAKEKIEEAS